MKNLILCALAISVLFCAENAMAKTKGKQINSAKYFVLKGKIPREKGDERLKEKYMTATTNKNSAEKYSQLKNKKKQHHYSTQHKKYVPLVAE